MGQHWRAREIRETERRFDATTHRTIAIIAVCGVAALFLVYLLGR